MNNIRVEISDWDSGRASNSLHFLAGHDDFDFKNLSLGDHSYLYENGFGTPAKLVSAFNGDGEKIGHAVLYERGLRQSKGAKCVLMSDFYVDAKYRNLRTVSRMYAALKAYLSERNVEALFSVSNEKSTLLNKRFLGISQCETLRFGIGIANCFTQSGDRFDVTSDVLNPRSAGNYSEYFNHSHLWDVDSVRLRIGALDEAFKAHCFGDVLVVSQRTRKMGVPLALISGIFSRNEGAPKLEHKMLDGICSSHRVPFYSAEANDLPNGILKNFLFVKKLSVYHRAMPQDQRYCLLDLDLSLGVA